MLDDTRSTSGQPESANEDAAGHVSELVLMGTGTSIGVPVVGCACAVCTSGNTRNQRTRSGVLVNAPNGEFVIDTGPEFRLQLLRSGASLIRAALFTHAHADHIMGLDDLRIFGFRIEKEMRDEAEREAEATGVPFDESAFVASGAGRIPLYCEPIVEDAIRHTFHYAFSHPASYSHRFAAPKLSFERVSPGNAIQLLGLEVLPIRLHHGNLPILGYRIGNVAFCTDISTVPAESRTLLEGLDTLIIDALRYKPHPTHLTVAQAVQWAERLKPRRTILTHMSHELDYDQLRNELPEHVEPGYDGLRITLL